MYVFGGIRLPGRMDALVCQHSQACIASGIEEIKDALQYECAQVWHRRNKRDPAIRVRPNLSIWESGHSVEWAHVPTWFLNDVFLSGNLRLVMYSLNGPGYSYREWYDTRVTVSKLLIQCNR